LIPSTSIKENGFYTTLMGNIDNFKKLNIKIESDCRLIYNYNYKTITLFVPTHIKGKNIKNRSPVVALDPGEKVF
jgi:hypothetical protein